MANQAKEKSAVKIDFFGRPVFEHQNILSDSSLRTRDEITLKLNPDGSTTPVVSGEIDLVEEIQTWKDDAGFEGMRKLLRSGQAVPQDFEDDGKHSGDGSVNTMLAGAAMDVPEAARLKALENQIASLQAQIESAKAHNSEVKENGAE